MKCASCGCAITAEMQKGHHYYHCTKKKGPCPEKHFLREEKLIEQIKNYLQKVSLSSQDTKKVLTELEKDELKSRGQTKIVVQNFKKELAEIEQLSQQKGQALIPLAFVLKERNIKLEFAVARGKKLHDKRQDLKKKDLARDSAREMKGR